MESQIEVAEYWWNRRIIDSGSDITEDLGMKVIESTKKGSILFAQTPVGLCFETRDSEKIERQDALLVIYPKSHEHAESFRLSGLKREKGGPARFVPGSVGSLSASQVYVDGSLRRVVMVYLQASFRQDEHVNRSLASYYGGWRNRAINFFIDNVVSGAGCEIQLPPPPLDNRTGSLDVIIALLEKRDFSINSRDGGVYANPQG